MIVTANRLRSIGWLALLGVCGAMVLVLAFRVNALKSEVRKSENRIVALKQEKMYLETEFETRANQQQLEAWNDLDFGYVAPGAGQYLEGERQLAALGNPAGPDAPAPIRVASIDDAVTAKAAFPAMVSPLTGKPVGVALRIDAVADGTGGTASKDHPLDRSAATASLGKRLTLLSADDTARPAKTRTQAVDKSAEKLAAPRNDAKDRATKRSAGHKVSGKTEGAAQAQRR